MYSHFRDDFFLIPDFNIAHDMIIFANKFLIITDAFSKGRN